VSGARKKNGRLSILSFAQVFSIDVVLASLSLSAMILHIAGIDVDVAYWFVISLSVWAVYTADHLVDASLAGNRAVSLRHRVHLKYRKLMTVLMALAASAALGLALAFLPPSLILAGIWLAAASAAYLVLLLFLSSKTKHFYFKEPVVALIFSLGIWLAPISLQHDLGSAHYSLMAITYVSILANLILNSVMETDQDKRSGFASLGMRLGSRRSLFIMFGGILVSLLLSWGLYVNHYTYDGMTAAFILIIIQLCFLIIFYLRHRAPISLLRFVGDIAFILCFIPLFLL
jgi:4-hydroxybenzoate polyprenyltransferase